MLFILFDPLFGLNIGWSYWFCDPKYSQQEVYIRKIASLQYTCPYFKPEF